MSDLMAKLPKYNPDPVFIFNSDGSCSFKNDPATYLFENLNNIKEIRSDINIEELIQESLQKSITHKIENRYYLINLVGVKDESVIMAYTQEITELIKSMHKEKDTMRIKNDFFRNISHEMKTPLSAIVGLLPLLKKSIKEMPKLLKIVDIIEESSNTLQKQIEKIFDVQSIQNNQLTLKPQYFELLPVLEKIFTSYKLSSEKKEQVFKVIIDKQNLPVKILSDQIQFIKIISSLLDNAIKFTPKGATISSKIIFEEKKQLLIITIEDKGIGISEKNQKKIFLAQQLDGSLTRAHEGTGLELFIVSQILNSMNGTIELQSTLTKGSTFTITLPTK